MDALSDMEIAQFLCLVCTEITLPSNQIVTKCGHSYCHGCVVRMFEMSLTSQTNYPPKCCPDAPPISLDHAQAHGIISNELAARCRAHGEEIKDGNRLYCHIQTCSAYIPANFRSEGTAGECPECSAWTCVACKGVLHSGADDCQEAKLELSLAALADEQGWQRCLQCQRMVSKSGGCNHMTCTCGFQFCYLCGVEWKSCGCSQFDEDVDMDYIPIYVDDEGEGEDDDDGDDNDDHIIDQPDPDDRAWMFDIYPEQVHVWEEIEAEGRFRCYYCLVLYEDPIWRCRECGFQACPGCRIGEHNDSQLLREHRLRIR